ncbi:DUF3224 domain-containing protein [Ktedonosporobacter rubrisoli]|uniref:DUF3224 domain-containing protein n=1 Tax=Ktedonosporobacter rubrisoli TaxID=2509675 RepID=A0A4P6JMU6_KTERU|nr:DUF3224 domain-containing protein [Ktedonosporobacter rubrisoli]QBD76608.1 DUF3224 domain-containing protein [Ktedonosporobacter rubrisoli]
MIQANTTRKVKGWQRKTWHHKTEVPGTNLFRIEMIHHYEGALEGEGSIQYLIAQNKNLTGSVIALEKVTGSIAGRAGSFVFQQIGTFEHGRLKLNLTVVPGSGTDQLSGLRGQAKLESELHQEVYLLPFEYTFEESE